MPSPRLALLLPAAIAAVALCGCIGVDAGPATTQARDVAAFTRVQAEDKVDVDVRAGAPPRVVVRAGEKVVDDVRTEVRDGTLFVAYDGPGVRNGRLLVDVHVRRLDAVTSTGTSDVRIDGLTAAALDVRVTGAGDLTAAGRVERLALAVDGAGDADLSRLAATEARVDLRGSGDADVHAVERLDADVSGSGDLVYRGDPSLRQRTGGSGEIEHRG